MSYQSIVWIQYRFWLLHLVYWYYHGILHCFDISYCLYGQIILSIVYIIFVYYHELCLETESLQLYRISGGGWKRFISIEIKAIWTYYIISNDPLSMSHLELYSLDKPCVPWCTSNSIHRHPACASISNPDHASFHYLSHVCHTSLKFLVESSTTIYSSDVWKIPRCWQSPQNSHSISWNSSSENTDKPWDLGIPNFETSHLWITYIYIYHNIPMFSWWLKSPPKIMVQLVQFPATAHRMNSVKPCWNGDRTCGQRQATWMPNSR